METAIITVKRIVSEPVSKGLTQYLIDGLDAERLPVQCQTVNSWLASVCDRSLILEAPVELQIERTRFGPTLRYARLVR